MLYSVIIPVYNCKEYVDECIGSVSDQITEDCELIIVDDGSTDGTQDIIRRYEASRNNITVIRNDHKGPAAGKNAGLAVSKGDYISFIDSDDRLKNGFLFKSLPLIEPETDLYIFGIERNPLSGIRESMTLTDRVFPDSSVFADAYIREHRFLIYSSGNKFYKRSHIEELGLRFDENIAFGADRLFNYKYLEGCGKIVASSLVMLEYIQRTSNTAASKHVPGFFDCVMELHKAKMDCFLNLSKDTSIEEQIDFISYDLTKEMEVTINRFNDHPEEIEENLPKLNAMIFKDQDDPSIPVDFMLVTGSSNCEYKAVKAVELGKNNPDLIYIVSGGNLHKSETKTEAEYMADYLKEHGIPENKIHIENRSRNTDQSLLYSFAMIKNIRNQMGLVREETKTGIITGAFHIPRTKLIAERIPTLTNETYYFFPAYGASTSLDNWYHDSYGRQVILEEYKKLFWLANQPDYSMEE